MDIQIVEGDILDQEVEVIVNSWNRNIIPWWLLFPQGVSGSIKKMGGNAPFKEVSKYGPIPLGEARLTGTGSLPFKYIIHVAGINICWRGSEYSVSNSVLNAMKLIEDNDISSAAFPLIGSGSGNRGQIWSQDIMQRTFDSISSDKRVIVVKYAR